MNHRCTMIIVEGYDDQEFIQKILKIAFGFEKFDGRESQLIKISPFWDIWKPKQLKPRKNEGLVTRVEGKEEVNLYERVNMPKILYRDNLSVGIFMGNGGELPNFLKDVDSTLSNLPKDDFDLLEAICLFIDADQDEISLAFKRAVDWMRDIAENHFPEIDFASEKCKPGCLMGKSKKLGIYIIPDNQSQGTLEQIILQCGDLVYSDYMSKSRSYINQYPEFQWKKPASREKATIAAVVSVLQPGLTNTVSFARDNWISKETLEQVPDMVQLVQFLKELLGIED